MLSAEVAMGNGQQRCLILELGQIDRLNNFATDPGQAPNLFLVAEVGGQRLICQPLLASKAGAISTEAPFDERFVIFLDGDAERAVRDGPLQIKVTLWHKQVEDDNFDQDNDRHGGDEQRQSIGGPPYFCASLEEQVGAVLPPSLHSYS